MTSQRPYLIRALWEWIADNGMTPHLLVDAAYGGVRVPPHTVNDGKVVLNIADRAVAHLQMGNEDIAFSARFGGVTHAIIVPIGAVLAIYARETGQGMALPPEEDGDGDADGFAHGTGAVDDLPSDEGSRAASGAARTSARPAPAIRVVADDEGTAAPDAGNAADGEGNPGPDGGGNDKRGDGEGGGNEPPSPPSGGRPRLRVVK